MTPSPSKSAALLVVGSGPGIGHSTASVFAQNKFNRITLISRSWSRLQASRVSILSALSNTSPTARQVEIETWAVDIMESVKFQIWSKRKGDIVIECVLFNAARVDFSDLCGGYEERSLVYDFMTTTAALHTTFTWFLPLAQSFHVPSAQITPSFLVTIYLLWSDPIPQMFSLSLVKASQRNLVLSL
ncbi:hypothetical protein F5884DRAFT_743106 [Xylogone sp. PMI_703]|nr:hypothetical protein F5884DRAFT_743106 [Xylogone sp. PMI_703]